MIKVLDKKLDKDTLKHYFIQSSLAAVILYISLNLPFITSAVLMAAIGSTAFVVFAMPSSKTARPRNVLGSHLSAGLIGLLFSQFSVMFLPELMAVSIALGVSIFVMVTLDVEHPPAGGTVIFLVLTPVVEAFLTLLLLASIMALMSYLLKPYLRDLV